VREVEKRWQVAMKERDRARVLDHGPQIRKLEAEVENLVSAIASGGLKS
jgi:hypothetical protein